MSEYLPPEIWEKIFLRLPIKTLLICISVCKDWKSLINNQSFIQQSANNINNNSLFLHLRCGEQSVPQATRRRYDKVFSIYSDHDENHLSIPKLALNDQAINCNNFNVIGTCNGLVCLCDSRNLDTIILMNPSIRKYMVLIKSVAPLESSYRFNWVCNMIGFGFNSKDNDFKVVKLSLSYREKTTPWVEVYSLNTGKWRSIKGRGPSLWFSSCGSGRDPMFMNGALHWLVCGNQFGRRHNTVILSFDLVSETFGEFMLPKCFDDFQSHTWLSLLNGGNSLALVYKKRVFYATFDIWVMKEYGNVDSWNMIFSFDSRRYGGIARVIAMRNSGELVLERYSHEIILLDPKTDMVRYFGLQGHVCVAGDIEESLFMINEENSASLITI